MDDNEHLPDDDRRPHLALERHLTVGRHVYQLTASGTGEDRVNLTVVGWNPGGEVVSELSGGISPDDLTAVADALTSTLAGLGTLRRQRLKPAKPEPARRHPHQGARWSATDDERLVTRFREGASPKVLMEEFGRSRGGINSRLVHLGLIAPEDAPTSRLPSERLLTVHGPSSSQQPRGRGNSEPDGKEGAIEAA
jgi:hypothetical protein